MSDNKLKMGVTLEIGRSKAIRGTAISPSPNPKAPLTKDEKNIISISQTRTSKRAKIIYNIYQSINRLSQVLHTIQ